MTDILDTRFEGKDVELKDHRVKIGDDMNLTAKEPTLRRVLVGVGWDLNTFNADVIDLDFSAFLIGKDGLTRVDEDFIFYNHSEACNGAIRHTGDSRTGAGDGDDESMLIDLHGIPFDVMRILFVVSAYKGEEKEQNLGMVRNAYLRVVNADNAHEMARYQMDSDLTDRTETGVIVAALDREGPKWHFRPQGEFVQGGLAAMATRFGLVIAQQ